MQVQHFPADQLIRYDKLIQSFIRKSPELIPFVQDFVSIDSLKKYAASRDFSNDQRVVLTTVLSDQYGSIQIQKPVQENLSKLALSNSFTVTTGHQLCLFTGPLYAIFKVASTIKLSQELQKSNQQWNIIPIFWMATEDHDSEEINHAYFFGKKLTWQVPSAGPVGRFNPAEILPVIDQLREVLGNLPGTEESIDILKIAYSKPSLSAATRYLFNALFEKYGLLILDADDHRLKREFIVQLKDELFHEKSYHAINKTDADLKAKGFNTQINSRNINLFYMLDGMRSRIERNENVWRVVDHDMVWTQDQILAELEQHPERFSPNVAMRPVYQEKILPNLAYVGGPGEIAYWLQLKNAFETHGVPFPLLVLRDSALLLSDKMSSVIKKLGINIADVFSDRVALEKRLVNADEFSLQDEMDAINSLMASLESKVAAIDPTLSGAVNAEAKKMSQGLEQIGRKVLKAMKQKEEVKLNQWNKLHTEVFPDGILQERHDNFFQYRNLFDENLIDVIIREFQPLNNQFTVISNN